MLTKRFGGLWRFLAVAMLLCAFMTAVWSDGVEAATDTTLTVSAATGTYGGTVTLSARLTSGGSNVSGVTISFTLHNVSVGTNTTDSNGIAILTGVNLSGINASIHPAYIMANFSGDATYSASGNTSTLTVTRAPQTISFTTAPPSSAIYGTNFTVAATATSGLAVTYSSSGAASNSGGLYTMTSGTGNATVIVSQAGNTNYSAATSLHVNVTAVKANQTISFTEGHSPPSSAVYGTNFTVVATATSGLAVTYSSSGAASNSGGKYNMTSGTGNATIIVNQGGDTNYSAAPALTANVTAIKNSSSTALTSSTNPSFYNQSVTFTANVSGHSGTPTGNVTFMEGSTILAANVTMSGGRATFTTSTFTVASHAITAVYNGDTNFNRSTASALNQMVNKAGTTTSVNTSCNLSTHGQLVTLTAIVTGAGASGTVTFMDGAAALGNATLSAGTATFNVSTLPVGTHAITAVYSGDGNFLDSTSAALTQTVKSSINWGLIGGLITAGIVVIITLVVTLVIVLRRRRS